MRALNALAVFIVYLVPTYLTDVMSRVLARITSSSYDTAEQYREIHSLGPESHDILLLGIIYKCESLDDCLLYSCTERHTEPIWL